MGYQRPSKRYLSRSVEASRKHAEHKLASIDVSSLRTRLNLLLPTIEASNLDSFVNDFCQVIEVFWRERYLSPPKVRRDQHLKDFKKSSDSLNAKIHGLLNELYQIHDHHPDILSAFNNSGGERYRTTFSDAAVATLDAVEKLGEVVNNSSPLPPRASSLIAIRQKSLKAIYRIYHRHISEKVYTRKGHGLYEVIELFLNEIEQPQSSDNMRKIMTELQKTKILKPIRESTATQLSNLAAIVSQSGLGKP